MLLGKYTGGYVGVYRQIFKRWLKLKKIVWPEEVQHFNHLFVEKHPEIISGYAIENEMRRYAYLGAVYDERGYREPVTLFGFHDSILLCEPVKVKPSDRDKFFFKQSTKALITLCKSKRTY
jgi:hypothetical protein